MGWQTPDKSGNNMIPAMISVKDLKFFWKGGEKPLIDMSGLEVAPGESVFIQGESGSGKSTLLNLLTGIFLPQQGSITIAGTELGQLSQSGRDRFRARHLGVIFQQFNLIPYLSVIENVKLPLRFIPRSVSRRGLPEPRLLLQQLRIADNLHHAPVNRLSVGEQQRVAIARALIGGQEIIIADEPTSSLDEGNQHSFMEMLFTQVREHGKTLVMVSHDSRLASWFSRVLFSHVFNREEINKEEISR